MKTETKHTPERSPAWEAGFDAGKNGPNTTNSHFVWFSCREDTAEWEAGYAEGKKAKAEGRS